jgi:hypothetical protein
LSKLIVTLAPDPEPTTTNPVLESHRDDERQRAHPGLKLSENKKATKPRRSIRSSGISNNWFARVFQFKPATRVVALNVSKIKGRKEIYKMLRDWKQYGIEDIHLDKPNSIIYGRVGESNCTSNFLPLHSPPSVKRIYFTPQT